MRNLKEILKGKSLLLRFEDDLTGMLYRDELGRLYLEILSEDDFSNKRLFGVDASGNGGFYVAVGQKIPSLLAKSVRYHVKFIIWGRGEFNGFEEGEIQKLVIRYDLFFPERLKELYEKSDIKLGKGYVGSTGVLNSESYEYARDVKEKHFALECEKAGGIGIDLNDIRGMVARADAILSCLVGGVMRARDVLLIYGAKKEVRVLVYASGAMEHTDCGDDLYMINDGIDFGKAFGGMMEKDLAPAFNLKVEFEEKIKSSTYYEHLLGSLYKAIDVIAGRDFIDEQRKVEFGEFMAKVRGELGGEDLEKFKDVLKFLNGTADRIYVAGSFERKMNKVLEKMVQKDGVDMELFGDLCKYSNVQRNSIMHGGGFDYGADEKFLSKYPEFNVFGFLEKYVRCVVEEHICRAE